MKYSYGLLRKKNAQGLTELFENGLNNLIAYLEEHKEAVNQEVRMMHKRKRGMRLTGRRKKKVHQKKMQKKRHIKQAKMLQIIIGQAILLRPSTQK